MGEPSRNHTSTAHSDTFLREIANEHLTFIARYLSRLGVRAQDIDDVAQEVLAGAYRAMPRFDRTRGNVRTWLMGIATHQASNHLRRAHHRREHLRPVHELEALPDAAADSEQYVIATDRRVVLNELLAELPLERRSVFIAHEILELDMVEIAAALSIPLSTAWSRHRLAREDMEAAMRRWHARQRSRGLAAVPLGLTALVSEGRAEHLALSGRFGRFLNRVRDTIDRIESHGRAFVGNILLGTSAPVLTGGVVGALIGATFTGTLVFGLMRASMAREPAAVQRPELVLAPVPGFTPATLGPAKPMALSRIASATGTVPDDTARPARSTAEPPRAPPPTRSSEDPEIAKERALLLRAMTALSAGRGVEAKQLLDQHAREFPTGRLAAEREAALRALDTRTPL